MHHLKVNRLWSLTICHRLYSGSSSLYCNNNSTRIVLFFSVPFRWVIGFCFHSFPPFRIDIAGNVFMYMYSPCAKWCSIINVLWLHLTILQYELWWNIFNLNLNERTKESTHIKITKTCTYHTKLWTVPNVPRLFKS